MLPSSGAISLSDIRTELAASGTISLNDTAVRTLSGKTTPGSSEIMPTDFYGKSNAPPPSPTYSFQSYSSTINEGSQGAYYIATTLVPTGTTLYWTINHITTSDADFTASNGSFSVNNNIGSFLLLPVADSRTEGPETCTVSIRTGSISGTVVATSITITIGDTSIGREPQIPGAPIIGVATATGSTTATVAFTAPSDDGGATITTYTAISTPGSISASVSQSGSGTITVTGLSSNTSYTFKVKAINSVGDSSYSADSNPITTAAVSTVPGAPTIGVATSTGSTTATVSYTAPASNGGAAITSYTAISTPGNFTGILSQSGSGIITVSGLSPSTSYTFKVKATNSVGDSAYSSSTSSITTGSSATAPGAPTIGTAISTGSTTATVAFTAPASNGGAAITSYTAISTPGSITGTISQSGSGTINITGLTAGTSYTFKVKSTNSVGDSSYSADSNSITTTAAATVPGAPTIGSAIPTGQTTASVSFTPPSSDGGAAITSYSAISTPGSITATGSSSPITVTGLTASTSYTFKVRATNTVGNGSYSSDSASITTNGVPTVPGAPTITGATTTGETTASVSFSAPASNGGSPITSYTILSSPGSITATLSQAGGGTFNVTGLTAGTSYTFTIKATNAVGDSSYSSASSSITTTSAGPAIGFDNGAAFSYLNDQGNPPPLYIKWYIGNDGSIDGSGDFSGESSAAGTVKLSGPTKYVDTLTPGIGSNYEVKVSIGTIGTFTTFSVGVDNYGGGGTTPYHDVGTGIYISYSTTSPENTRSVSGTIYIRNKTTLSEISRSFTLSLVTGA
jgi:chitodextrinase